MLNRRENSERQYPRKDVQLTYLLQPPVDVLTLEGKDVIDFIHRMSTNDMRDMVEGAGKTTILTNEKGRIIDVVDLYFLNGSIHLVHSIAAGEPVKQVFEKFVIMEDVAVIENPGYTCVLSMDGGSGSQEIFSGEGRSLEMLSPRIYPEGKLYFVSEQNLKEMNLMKNGQSIDFQSFNILRLEKGIPLHGVDFDDSVNPLESNLHEYISWTKGCYIGQEVIARLDTYQKIKRFLKGVVLTMPISETDRIRIENKKVAPVITSDGNSEIGKITSFGYSTALGTFILMARFEKGMEKTGNRVEVVVGESSYTGEIVDLPFVKSDYE